MCTFSVEYKGDLKELFNLGKREALNLKGELRGDTKTGDFNIPSPLGLFKGSYSVNDQTINVKLEKKPFYLTTSFIKNNVINYLTAFNS